MAHILSSYDGLGTKLQRLKTSAPRPSERCKVREINLWRSGKNKHASMAVYMGMKDAEIEHVLSPDNRNGSLKETCPDHAEQMLIMWSTENCSNDWAERHEYKDLKGGELARTDNSGSVKKDTMKSGRRSTSTQLFLVC